MACLTALVAGAGCGTSPQPVAAPEPVAPAEVRAIAKDAYIYGYPLVDNYRFTHARVANPADEMYLGGFNVFEHEQDVAKAGQKAVQAINADTPYSRAVVDLRAEPIVLTVPQIEGDRYHSVQFVDMYTHNFAYVGSRTTGNGGGRVLITGPGWTGKTPAGITTVVASETDLAFLVVRTQLIDPADLPNVARIQAGHRIQPLSQFLGQPPPTAAPAIPWIAPLATAAELKTSLAFFEQLNFAMSFCPPHPSEKDLLARFARIGVGPGKTFDAAALTPERRAAIEAGIGDAWQEFAALQKRAAAGAISSKDLLGTREELKNNYLHRWAGDVLGIYGNTAAEAVYPGYTTDGDGKPLDASTGRYTLRIDPASMPAKAFWSVTMYDEPDKLLVPNRLNRYLVNSPMLPRLRKDGDGRVTLYLQSESPGKDRESNWLPAPDGPFFVVMRLYWPEPGALDGTWKQPSITKTP